MLCKSDANNVSICSLSIYWKKILGRPRILSFLIWIGGIRNGARIPTDWVEGFCEVVATVDKN